VDLQLTRPVLTKGPRLMRLCRNLWDMPGVVRHFLAYGELAKLPPTNRSFLSHDPMRGVTTNGSFVE